MLCLCDLSMVYSARRRVAGAGAKGLALLERRGVRRFQVWGGEGREGDSGRGLLLAGRRFGGRHLVRGVRERRFQLDVLGVGGRGLLARAALGPEAVQREASRDHEDGGGDDEADDEADARRGRAGRASRALLAEDVDRAPAIVSISFPLARMS